jgi:biopolymer transport protein ExbD
VKVRRHRTPYSANPETDVTAFLSLMVILVPFLLITAVFSRMTIIELQESPLKGREGQPGDAQPLQLMVQKESIEVVHPAQGRRVRLSRTKEGGELEALAGIVQGLKKDNPQDTRAIILLDPEVRYDLLIQVMDIVRTSQSGHTGSSEYTELFPDISLGELPGGTDR